MNSTKQHNNKESLTSLERGLEVVLILTMMLLFGFFVYHQVTNTGFFTDKFGTVEMICLYGPLIFAWIAPAVRTLSGHRNPARPFEAATNLFLALGSLWLLIVFPFSFPHLADALPAPIRFVLVWTTDGFGQAILILQVVVGTVTTISKMRTYVSVRHQQVAVQ